MNIIEIIKKNPKTFPNPMIILNSIKNPQEVLLLGINKQGAYLASCELKEASNKRYYPDYKILENFEGSNNLSKCERYLFEAFDATIYDLILDELEFKNWFLS